LSSYTATIVFLLIYALGLALATLIEKYLGTQAAKIAGLLFAFVFSAAIAAGCQFYTDSRQT